MAKRAGVTALRAVGAWIVRDKVFLVSFILAVLSVVFGQFDDQFFDWKVILTVFGLMLVIAGFQSTGFLRFLGQTLAKRSRNTRQLVRFTTMLSFFCAILFTNDVTILTILPIYLGITREIKNRRSVYMGAALILPAVHMGSALLPSGNPHNLYLYSIFKIPNLEFLRGTGFLFIAGFVLLNIACQFIDKEPVEISTAVDAYRGRKTLIFMALMVVMVISVLGWVPYVWGTVFVAAVVAAYRPKLFGQVDYHLLLTFICFFLIVGNISNITMLTHFLSPFFKPVAGAFLGTILVSQLISNIPAAMLVSPFTQHGVAVVLGADVGGIGTMMASMATLIFYKIITVQAKGEARGFVKYFTIVNISFVVTLAVVGLLILLL